MTSKRRVTSLAFLCVLFCRTLAAESVQTEPGGLLTAVPMQRVKIKDSFWAYRQRINCQHTIPHLIEMCEGEGRVRNMLRAAGQLEGGFEGTRTHDADLFKVIEAASFALMLRSDPRLEARLDGLIDAIAAAQRADGYLHSYFQIRSGRNRHPTRLNLFACGHLIDAGVTHYLVTGKRSLLSVAIRMADLIDSRFGPGKEKGVPSHPKIESALVRLADSTRDQRYMRLSEFFINERGRAAVTGRESGGLHQADYVPLRELRQAESHVIGGLFLYESMFDIGQRLSDSKLLEACDRLFDDAVGRRMYITGAMGRQSDERFTEPYALENRTSLGEGCQSAGLMRFARRLLLHDPDARYADVIERVIYNNLAANVGLGGVTFYYQNRLSARPEDATGFPYSGIVTETDRNLMPRNALSRQPWFRVPCCPPNVAMAIATLGGYVYAHTKDTVYVHQYLESTARLKLDKMDLTLNQKTRYPWDGEIALSIDPAEGSWEGTVSLRVPDWCRNLESALGLYHLESNDDSDLWTARVNGESIGARRLRKGYLSITRQWRAGDRIELVFPMPIRRVFSHASVAENRGRIALQRGPLVYCIEGVDHDGSVRDITLPSSSPLVAQFRPDLLGGVAIILGKAVRVDPSESSSRPIELVALPYAFWGNRQVGEMDVWLKTTELKQEYDHGSYPNGH